MNFYNVATSNGKFLIFTGGTFISFGINVPVKKNQKGQKLRPLGVMIITPEGMGIGVADCSPADTFDVDTGRKLAVTRALERFSKPERERIWKILFESGAIRIWNTLTDTGK